MINDTIADTWEPSQKRLTAVAHRALSGPAAAKGDFEKLKAGITSPSPEFGESSNEDANLNRLLDYAFAYAVYHKAHNDKAANAYAASAWTGMTKGFSPAYTITSIRIDDKGRATVTLAQPANPPITPGAYHFGVWGLSDDSLCGPITVASVLSPTSFTYQTGHKAASFTGPGMLGSTTWLGLDQHGTAARQLAQWSYFYDWCYDWLVANRHDQYVRDQIKAGFWSSTPTRQSSTFDDQIRESDFHNYSAWPGSAIIEAGAALYGDDPFGATILDQGIGYLWEGLKVRPAGCCEESYEYNLKKSIDALTGGAMNWEGPTYWRAGTIRFLRAFEAFDSASARQNKIWATQFPSVKLAGMYKVYLREPSGTMANFGDGGNSNSYAGRDNFGMAILNDRFPDPHFVWMMTHSPNDWNSGDSGQTGLVYKLIFFPYTGGPGSHDPSDLPPAGQFGPDVILRSGWGPNDTFITYTSSLPGVYHRHDDAGTFTIAKHGPLVLAQPYTLVEPAYDNYNRRTIGGNTLTVFDPQDCWKDQAPTCGLDSYKGRIVNDGGQLRTLRRFKNQFPTNEFQILRVWSGSVYSDPAYSKVFSEVAPIVRPVLTLGSGWEHVRHDLTKFYVNAYSGSGDNPHVKVAAPNGLGRDMVHFHAGFGSLDPLVIFDRITATNAAFKKSWLMHVVNPPSVDGARAKAGENSYAAAKLTQVDNDTGRLYVTHLLPHSPIVRAVGGSACKLIPILGGTNANPAVFYAPRHGLKPGEPIGISTGADGTSWWPPWLFDRRFGQHTIATVPDPDHFTISPGDGSDSTKYKPWKEAFLSGNGRPPKATFAGQMYYQKDAPNGNTVWQFDGEAWHQVATLPGLPQGLNYPGPVIYSHSDCNWSYYVDHAGPPGSGGYHMWNGSLDNAAVDDRPNWLVEESPSAHNLTDYFLNVLTATSTSDPNPPAATLIEASGVHGAQIADRAGTYVAIFSAALDSTGMQYSSTHAGPGLHVVSGLKAGAYAVTQNGNSLSGNFTADPAGSISFRETGGGNFHVSIK